MTSKLCLISMLKGSATFSLVLNRGLSPIVLSWLCTAIGQEETLGKGFIDRKCADILWREYEIGVKLDAHFTRKQMHHYLPITY